MGGVEKAKEFAHKYTKQALQNIAKLPECQAKNGINQLTKQLLQRTF